MSLRLAHVSDIHFGCENAAAVAAVGQFLDSERPDLLVVTGDITQSGERKEFAAARAWLQSLSTPTVCTPGNHDTPYWDILARLSQPFARYGDYIGPVEAGRFAAPGVSVAAMNTARGAQPRANWSKGQIRRRDALRARAALAEAGAWEDLKVVICHHPLMEVTGGPMTGRVWGGVRATQILAEGGADLILTGHVHTPFAHATPFGDGKTYAVGASTLSLRERGAPAGFNVIEADAESIRVTAQGWTGTHFEPQRTWGFDRRQAAAVTDSFEPAPA